MVDALFRVIHASGTTTFSAHRLDAVIIAKHDRRTVGLTPDERKHLMEAMRMLAVATTARNRNITR